MTEESKRALATRRSFLKAVGAAAAALPFYKLLENNVVLAATAALPLKFVGVGYLHCKPAPYYSRRAGETDTNYDIGYANCALRPFDDAATYGESFKSKTIILEGFGYGVGNGDSGAGEVNISMHGAMGVMLTGSSSRSGGGESFVMQNHSLDQYLAARYGGSTKFRSLELASVGDSTASSSASIAFGAGGTPLSRMISPEDVWKKFFAGFVPASTEQAAIAAAQRKHATSASVLDFVAQDLTRLNHRLAGAEKQKLDQHLTVVRDLENRLRAPPSAASTSCQPPTQRKAGADYRVANYWNGGAKDLGGSAISDRAAIVRRSVETHGQRTLARSSGSVVRRLLDRGRKALPKPPWHEALPRSSPRH